MMAQIISNKVYESLQIPTENYNSPKGTILYANQFSGIQQIGMPTDLAEVLNSNFGTIGNNILMQLEAKMNAYGNGPWYVDSINNVIYIHNRKFTQEPFCTYIYQQENGEVLKASFQTTRSTKKVMQTVSNYITPDSKQMMLNTSIIDDPQNRVGEGGNWTGFGVKDDTKLVEWWENSESTDVNDNTKFKHSQFERNPNFSTTYSAMANMKDRVKHETEENYKEYQANGSRAAQESDLSSIPESKYQAEVNQYLQGSYTKSDQSIMAQNIQSLVAGGVNLEDACRQVFGSSTMIFQNEYVTGYETIEVDPREFADGGKQTDDTVNLFKPQSTKDEEAQQGLNNLKADPHIKVIPGSYRTGTLIVNQPQAGVNQQYKHDVRYFAKVKIFKKVRKPVEIPLWKAMYNIYSRGDGPKVMERALTANANGGLKTTEKKLQVTLEVVGRPSLRTSMVLRLENVGQRWSGYWYVKKCTHRMDAGTGYITTMELIRNNGTSGVRAAGGNINTQQVVENGIKQKIAKNAIKAAADSGIGIGSNSSSSFNIRLTELEVRKFKSLEGNKEEQEKFIMRAAAYRDQNAHTPTKGNEGLVIGEVKAKVKDGKVVSEYVDINKERNVKNLKSVYRDYKFDMDKVIQQVNQDFSNKNQ